MPHPLPDPFHPLDPDAAELLATQLADANECEVAWALRGMVDAAEGDPCDPDELYGEYYERGYRALRKGDVVTEARARELAA